MKGFAVLVSGRGRNLQAFLDARAQGRLTAELRLVLADRPATQAEQRARAAAVATAVVPYRAYARREDFETALAARLDAVAPDVIVLAGFMRILTPGFIARYAGRLLNIHPSLLPKYPGLHTHERALAAGDLEHGATVHFVTAQLDGGPALLQGRVALRADDTPETLAARVLTEVEMQIYPLALRWVLEGRARLAGADLLWDGSLLAQPLQWSGDDAWRS